MSKIYRKTPVMGWASWNCFRTDINEERMKRQRICLLKRDLRTADIHISIWTMVFSAGETKTRRSLVS